MQRFNKRLAFSSAASELHLDSATAPFSRTESRDASSMILLVSSFVKGVHGTVAHPQKRLGTVKHTYDCSSTPF